MLSTKKKSCKFSIFILRKFFSSTKYNSHNKDKRLNDFFRLPKHDISQHNLNDTNLAREVNFKMSALNSYKTKTEDMKLDKQDLINRQAKIAEEANKSHLVDFFSNSTDQETIKMSQNLIEKLRLKKEFTFQQEYKKK